jgi:hypothetical protein
VTKVKNGDAQVLVDPTRTLFWRALDVLSTYSGVLQYFFSQLFRQFRILAHINKEKHLLLLTSFLTFASTHIKYQKNYFKVSSFRINNCAKKVVDYSVSKCHNRISEVEKSRFSLDFSNSFVIYVNKY